VPPTCAKVGKPPHAPERKAFAAQIRDENYLWAEAAEAPERPRVQTHTTTMQVAHVQLERRLAQPLCQPGRPANNFSGRGSIVDQLSEPQPEVTGTEKTTKRYRGPARRPAPPHRGPSPRAAHGQEHDESEHEHREEGIAPEGGGDSCQSHTMTITRCAAGTLPEGATSRQRPEKGGGGLPAPIRRGRRRPESRRRSSGGGGGGGARLKAAHRAPEAAAAPPAPGSRVGGGGEEDRPQWKSRLGWGDRSGIRVAGSGLWDAASDAGRRSTVGGAAAAEKGG
jgi:hypothetical protein